MGKGGHGHGHGPGPWGHGASRTRNDSRAAATADHHRGAQVTGRASGPSASSASCFVVVGCARCASASRRPRPRRGTHSRSTARRPRPSPASRAAARSGPDLGPSPRSCAAAGAGLRAAAPSGRPGAARRAAALRVSIVLSQARGVPFVHVARARPPAGARVTSAAPKRSLDPDGHMLPARSGAPARRGRCASGPDDWRRRPACAEAAAGPRLRPWQK